MNMPDPKEIVRRGYDALSYLYRRDAEEPAEYAPWVTSLRSRIPAGGNVLDVGCGCGIPVARMLAERGHAVTGVDISPVQIERARQLVPSARFIRADAIQIASAEESFDAVVSLYAMFHMPRGEQRQLLARIALWLRRGGWLLVITGATDWTGTEEGWLGGSTPMWWSHPCAATYRRWITEAGLEIVSEAYVPEGSGGHQLFWARRPSGAGWEQGGRS